MDEMIRIMDKVYPEIYRLPDECLLMALLGSMVDQWGADHDVSGERIEEMWKSLYDVSKNAHEVFGMPEKSTRKEG